MVSSRFSSFMDPLRLRGAAAQSARLVATHTCVNRDSNPHEFNEFVCRVHGVDVPPLKSGTLAFAPSVCGLGVGGNKELALEAEDIAYFRGSQSISFSGPRSYRAEPSRPHTETLQT